VAPLFGRRRRRAAVRRVAPTRPPVRPGSRRGGGTRGGHAGRRASSASTTAHARGNVSESPGGVGGEDRIRPRRRPLTFERADGGGEGRESRGVGGGSRQIAAHAAPTATSLSRADTSGGGSARPRAGSRQRWWVGGARHWRAVPHPASARVGSNGQGWGRPPAAAGDGRWVGPDGRPATGLVPFARAGTRTRLASRSTLHEHAQWGRGVPPPADHGPVDSLRPLPTNAPRLGRTRMGGWIKVSRRASDSTATAAGGAVACAARGPPRVSCELSHSSASWRAVGRAFTPKSTLQHEAGRAQLQHMAKIFQDSKKGSRSQPPTTVG